MTGLRGAAVGYHWISRVYRCMCGKGKIVNELRERDAQPHQTRDGGDWRIECADCGKNFVFEPLGDNLVRISNGEKISLSSLEKIGTVAKL